MPEGANHDRGREAPASSRHYQFSVHVDPGMLRRAAGFYMWRRFRLRYLAGWAGVGLGAAAYSYTDVGILTRALGVLTVALALVLVILPFAIWGAIRRTVTGYEKLTDGASVHYEVSEDWLTSHYANGSGELRWNTFSEVLKSDEVWLLVMANEDRFIPLPVDQVPEDAMLFVAGEIVAHGDR